MTRTLPPIVLVILLLLVAVPPAEATVVNENTDRLPPGCTSIAEEAHITVRAGTKYAARFPGVVYSFDNRSWSFPACTRLTVTFINEDAVRHQFMPHGAWPNGFFLLEGEDSEPVTGTFILGSEPHTLMVHCGLPQHQQKGMKAQILVAGGVGDVPNIPGVSGIPDDGTGDGDAGVMNALRNVPLDPSVVLAGLAAAGLVLRRRSTPRP